MGFIYEGSKRGKQIQTDLGGGMIGAILFALFYFLFDEAGTKIFAIVLIDDWFHFIHRKDFGESIE